MTIRENLESMDRRRRVGTREQVIEIRKRYDAGECVRDLFKDFPWSERQALAICKREAWREVVG